MDEVYELINSSVRNKNTQAFVRHLIRISYVTEHDKVESYYNDLTELYIEECLIQIKIDTIIQKANNEQRQI